MPRSRKYPTRLRWHFFWSLLLTVFVCASTLEILLISFVFVDNIALVPGQRHVDPTLMETAVAPQIAPYLAQDPPDVHDLQDWERNFVFQRGRLYKQNNHLWHLLGNVSTVSLAQVMDKAGVIISSVAADESHVHQLVEDVRSKAVVREALNYVPTEPQPAGQYVQVLDNGQIAEAVPILTYNGDLLGAFFTVFSQTSIPEVYYVHLAEQLAPWGAVACLIGWLAGWLVLNNVNRRIKLLYQTLERWECGENPDIERYSLKKLTQ